MISHSSYNSLSSFEATPKKDKTLRLFGRSVWTLFFTPRHIALHKDIEESCKDSMQQLQPDIRQTKESIEDILKNIDPHYKTKSLNNTQLLHYFALLVQFSEYSPEYIPDHLRLSYAKDIHPLKEAVCLRAEQLREPVGFSEQFSIAMGLSNHDVFKSLYTLWATSRTYARWLDEPLVGSDLQYSQRLSEMLQWRKAIRACKDTLHNQDPAGDNYYAWTHALAMYIFEIMPENKTTIASIVSTIFRHGTVIMKNIVHTINEQAVPNDHTLAAKYGVEIGETIVAWHKTRSNRIGMIGKIANST